MNSDTTLNEGIMVLGEDDVEEIVEGVTEVDSEPHPYLTTQEVLDTLFMEECLEEIIEFHTKDEFHVSEFNPFKHYSKEKAENLLSALWNE